MHRPLKVSVKKRMESTPFRPPATIMPRKMTWQIFLATLPHTFSTCRPTNVEKDMTVDMANSISATAAISRPAWPSALSKELMARTEPWSPVCHWPVERMTSAVKLQTMMVSINTSKMPQKPCSTGSLVLARG